MNVITPAPTLVLGARGKTGRRVVARLHDLRLAVRAASRSAPTRFDWDAPGTWGPALERAGAVYLVPPTEHLDASPVEDFVSQAVKAGVRRLVLLSGRGADHAGEPPVERAVRESGIPWTILRPSWFAQNFSEDRFLGPIQAGELALPTGEGREAFVDTDDVADVAVAALTRDGHAGEVYELSGPEPLSFRAAVSLIAEATGRRIGYRHVNAVEYAAAQAALGTPAEMAALLAGLLEGIGHGSGDYVSDGVHRALGRTPRAFGDYVKATAAAGGWPEPPIRHRA